MARRLRAVFMGTPDFAVPVFRKLCEHHDVVCVYTKPPVVKSGGRKVIKSPVHEAAEARGIEVRTPLSFKDEADIKDFAGLKADIAVVYAFGMLLPEGVIEAFPYKCINIHPSLLPKYRGSAPIQRALMNGDRETGVTVMRIARRMDSGDILMQERVPIDGAVNAEQLSERLSAMGADMVIETVKRLMDGTVEARVQDESQATYITKISKEECEIGFGRGAADLHNLIRGVYPDAFFMQGGTRINVLEAGYELGGFGAPGTVLDGGRAMACADGKLVWKRLKRAGRNEMDIESFLRGFSFTASS